MILLYILLSTLLFQTVFCDVQMAVCGLDRNLHNYLKNICGIKTNDINIYLTLINEYNQIPIITLYMISRLRILHFEGYLYTNINHEKCKDEIKFTQAHLTGDNIEEILKSQIPANCDITKVNDHDKSLNVTEELKRAITPMAQECLCLFSERNDTVTSEIESSIKNSMPKNGSVIIPVINRSIYMFTNTDFIGYNAVVKGFTNFKTLNSSISAERCKLKISKEFQFPYITIKLDSYKMTNKLAGIVGNGTFLAQVIQSNVQIEITIDFLDTCFTTLENFTITPEYVFLSIPGLTLNIKEDDKTVIDEFENQLNDYITNYLKNNINNIIKCENLRKVIYCS